MSCCLLLAAGKANRVLRRRCTEEDLQNPDILVLDQGGEHNPAKGNFDHHQLSVDHPPTCTISLILSQLGVSISQARMVWNWLPFAELVDSKGPHTTARHYDISVEALGSMVSPIETVLLRLFSTREEISLVTDGALASSAYTDILPAMMMAIGKDCLDQINKVVGRIELLRELAVFYEIDGLLVCDVTKLAKGSSPVMGLDLFLRSTDRLHCAVTVTNDERNNGYCLYRRGDDPRINFAALEGNPGITYVHKNGFVCRAVASSDVKSLIRQAMTKKEKA